MNNKIDELFQSTRPVRGGTIVLVVGLIIKKFQSTRPVRGGTKKLSYDFIAIAFQSTRPVRGGTRIAAGVEATTTNFNPPAPCGAGPLMLCPVKSLTIFQSTRPVRGGT